MEVVFLDFVVMVVLGFLLAPVVRVTVVFPVFVRVVILGPDFVDRMVMCPMEIIFLLSKKSTANSLRVNSRQIACRMPNSNHVERLSFLDELARAATPRIDSSAVTRRPARW